ncbi:MAG: hypothetical protein GY756_12840 [bacterium]|nr:hypothetical protein [bacterium]
METYQGKFEGYDIIEEPGEINKLPLTRNNHIYLPVIESIEKNVISILIQKDSDTKIIKTLFFDKNSHYYMDPEKGIRMHAPVLSPFENRAALLREQNEYDFQYASFGKSWLPDFIWNWDFEEKPL